MLTSTPAKEFSSEETIQKIMEEAKRGDPKAMNKLGLYYENIGNREMAANLFRQSAGKGHRAGQYNWGVCLENGLGEVEVNLREAFRFFKLSADQDYEYAQIHLVEYYQRKIAEEGNAGAYYRLGHCYVNAQGVEENLTAAFKNFKSAAEQGHAGGCFSLAVCYENAYGTDKNLSMAHRFYQKAYELGYQRANDKLIELSHHSMVSLEKTLHKLEPLSTITPSLSTASTALLSGLPSSVPSVPSQITRTDLEDKDGEEKKLEEPPIPDKLDVDEKEKSFFERIHGAMPQRAKKGGGSRLKL